MRLTGVVVSGMGRAGANMERAAASLARVTGSRPFPGTLNVQLAVPFEPPPGVVPLEVPGLGGREMPFRLYPARLKEIDVWVLRSLSQEEATDDLVEVIAALPLRAHLRLQDGDVVDLDFLAPPVPVRVRANVPWLLCPNRVELVLSQRLPPSSLVTSAFVIAYSQSDLLLVKHALRGWQVPGGHVEAGESPLDAARRELLEEAAVQISGLTLIGYEHLHILASCPAGYRYPYPHSYQAFYVARIESVLPFRATAEVLARQLFSPSELTGMELAQHYPELVQASRLVPPVASGPPNTSHTALDRSPKEC